MNRRMMYDCCFVDNYQNFSVIRQRVSFYIITIIKVKNYDQN